MFDIGFGEMIILAAIALVAIGPKQLPEVARAVGKFLNELKRASNDVTRTLVDARDTTNNMLADAERSFQQRMNQNNQAPAPLDQPEHHVSDPTGLPPTEPTPPVEASTAANLHHDHSPAMAPQPVVPDPQKTQKDS